jgi:hypothetical protein
MWQRRTFHECAEELGAISEEFRSAFTNRFGWGRSKCDQALLDSSRRGVEVLRILALSIRSEQDFGLTDDNTNPVGALKLKATESEVLAAIREYRPPYDQLKDFRPLSLRQALNKVAHADPTRSGFFADRHTHDLILSGISQIDCWIAVISLIDLCCAIKSLPDVQTRPRPI